jgi:hypothetical protein
MMVHRALRLRLRRNDVGLREIAALVEQRLPGTLGERVDQTVAKIEAVAPDAVPLDRVERVWHVIGAKCNDSRTRLGEERFDELTRRASSTIRLAREHEADLDNRRGREGCGLGPRDGD